MNKKKVPDVKYDAAGLIPAVVQDERTGAVLMVAWMNEESLRLTLETGFTHFWSRSRRTLWKKGETSGCLQRVVDLAADCDSDTLLVRVRQTGPACHTGSYSCFFKPLGGSGAPPRPGPEILDAVYRVILERKHRAPEGSYVASLVAGGHDLIAGKIVEEAAEVVEASSAGGEQLVGELADLWFHTLVLLGWHDLPPSEVFEELSRRFGKPGGNGSCPSAAGESAPR